MPHVRSASAEKIRYERAVRKGFIGRQTLPDSSYVEVKKLTVPNVKVMIGEEKVDAASSSSRVASISKHSAPFSAGGGARTAAWADECSSDSGDAAIIGARAPIDPLSVNDPWLAGRVPSMGCRAPDSANQWSRYTFSSSAPLRAEATHFVPRSESVAAMAIFVYLFCFTTCFS